MKRRLSRKRKMLIVAIGFPLAILLGGCVFLHTPSFGRLPTGKRLERIRQSPNYIDGEFRYPENTDVMTSSKSGLAAMWEFVTQSRKDTRPSQPVPSEKTDLHTLSREEDCIVWFGHSSYLLQVEGRRLLVDPVFYKAAPVGWANKPYPGTDLWKPMDMPSCDWLLITHDHWDHLDCATATKLRERIGRVVCPLGVGEHFARWDFAPERVVELDWDESATLTFAEGREIELLCLPTHHFSGRGFVRNQSLWASFLVAVASRSVYFGGDGGYDERFRRIGERFPGIDLAILENGQYNVRWQRNHMMPDELALAMRDLGAKRYLTGHHAKFCISTHPWDEPFANEKAAALEAGVNLITPRIGEIVSL